jgi:CheY-like chemotaxis protein
MSTEVVVALIASGVSLIVSVLSSRHSARSGKEIERLKHGLSRDTTRESIFDAQQAESLKALELSIKAIQRVKDEVQVILSATEVGSDYKSLMDGMRVAREQMFACYEEHMATLDRKEGKIVHSAKNISLHIEAYLKRSLPPQADVIFLSGEQRGQLLAFRDSLTDLQGVLRDSRMDRLMRRLGVPSDIESSQVDAPELTKATDKPSLPPASLEGLRLLVVDDQPSTCELISMFLAGYGVQVEGANSAVEALSVFIDWKPDILVSDIGMPDEDGYWLIEQVRSLNAKEGGGIPALAVTGGWDREDRERLISAGYTMCVPKPVIPSELLDAVTRLAHKATS